MKLSPRPLAWFCLATLACAGAAANSLSADVQVRVKLVTSSGVCGAAATDPAGDLAVQVSCHPPRGPLLPDPGDVPYKRVGTVDAAGVGVATEPLSLYSAGTKITSWRIVQLDNARYLELTIAW